MHEERIVVIDSGSYCTKAGYADPLGLPHVVRKIMEKPNNTF
jgi:actin-related protein